MSLRSPLLLFIALALLVSSVASFQGPRPVHVVSSGQLLSFSSTTTTRLFEGATDEVVELADDEEGTEVAKVEGEQAAVAPFLSQGEISEEAMEMDFSDPKQARVMFYIILSLLPVLFLIPLMLGSRDLIPVEMLPPVELSN